MLHGFTIVEVVYPAVHGLADPPRTASGLPHGEEVVPRLVEDDGRIVVATLLLREQVEPGLHKLWVTEHDIVVASVLLDPLLAIDRLARGRPKDANLQALSFEQALEAGLDIPLVGDVHVHPRLPTLGMLLLADVDERLLLGIHDILGQIRRRHHAMEVVPLLVVRLLPVTDRVTELELGRAFQVTL